MLRHPIGLKLPVTPEPLPRRLSATDDCDRRCLVLLLVAGTMAIGLLLCMLIALRWFWEDRRIEIRLKRMRDARFSQNLRTKSSAFHQTAPDGMWLGYTKRGVACGKAVEYTLTFGTDGTVEGTGDDGERMFALDGGGYDLSTGDIVWRELYLTCSLVVEVAGTLAQQPDQPLKIHGEFFANTGVHGPIELVQGPMESRDFRADRNGLPTCSDEPPAPSKTVLTGDGPWAPPPAPQVAGSQPLQPEVAASDSTTAHDLSPAVSPSEALSPLEPQPQTRQLSDEAAPPSCGSPNGSISPSEWVDEPGALHGGGSIPVEGTPAWLAVASTPSISASGSPVLERAPPLGSYQYVAHWELVSEKTEDQWPWLGDLKPAPRRVSFGGTELHTFDWIEGEREFILPSCVNVMNLMFFYDDDSDEDGWEHDGERTPRSPVKTSTTGSE